MKAKELPLLECSINDIYCQGQESKTYLIPIYQRNYAWQEDEIRALIKDVYELSAKNKIITDWIENKIKSTYVYIEEGWRDCQFQHEGWLKR